MDYSIIDRKIPCLTVYIIDIDTMMSDWSDFPILRNVLTLTYLTVRIGRSMEWIIFVIMKNT